MGGYLSSLEFMPKPHGRPSLEGSQSEWHSISESLPGREYVNAMKHHHSISLWNYS